MTDGELNIELGFRLAVLNSVEQQNLFNSIPARKAHRAGIEPGRPIFAILNEFIDEKIAGVMRQDRLEAMRALRELRWVLQSLVYGIKHPEFKRTLEVVEDLMAGITEVLRQHLVKAYRDPTTPREKLPEINATLVEIIECGAWPNWQEEVEGWGRPDDRASA
jgi:hypothetical protein